jgi:redox-sensitive bicupin YhaK (pirin superfamily)
MPVVKRPAAERGHFKNDWLDARPTFSFGDYYDPRWMGFGALRVINDDFIAAGAGFPMHAHRDMEIITVVLEGALEHRDSMGNGEIIRPGDVQKMSAGTGVRHSEFNPSKTERTHSLQIWIIPERDNLPTMYDQKSFPDRAGEWTLLASRDARAGSIVVYQDVSLLKTMLNPGGKIEYALEPNRCAWLHVADGALSLNGIDLETGDGVAVTAETALALEARALSRVLLFDLANEGPS